MNTIAAFIILAACMTAMALGLLLAKKVLKKGCSIDPESCACRKEGKDPNSCQ